MRLTSSHAAADDTSIAYMVQSKTYYSFINIIIIFACLLTHFCVKNATRYIFIQVEIDTVSSTQLCLK